MDLGYLIKEEIESYISEILPDGTTTPVQQQIKNMTKDDIRLTKMANGYRYEIGFTDPKIDTLFKQESEIARPSIMLDPQSYNYINQVEPIPQSFRNLGLGKKIYEKLSDILGFISSSQKDQTTDTDRSLDANRVWDSLKRLSTSYYIDFPNGTIFLVSPNITDLQEDKLVEYIRKTNTNINNLVTNLPPNWLKGLSMMI